MAKASREETICLWLERIGRSRLGVEEYFARHPVPFSAPQYYRYKKKLAEGGVQALRDGRARGNHRCLGEEAEGFLQGYVTAHPEASLQELDDGLQKRFGIEVSHAGISLCLKRLGCMRRPRSRANSAKRMQTTCGGFELIVGLACHLRWPEAVVGLIVDRVKKCRRKQRVVRQKAQPDRRGRRLNGQFTARYNRRQDVRENRFQSIELKRPGKRLEGMSIASASKEVLARKCLAALALPIITNNGVIRSADNPLGNALLNLCGVNYKQVTLNKFLSELKYLGMSDAFLRDQVSFWQQHWKRHPRGPLELPMLCYYVDGNTKPLWSKKRVKKNKVTMLGRVMGCLEHVFIHDNYGRPIYFETHSGQAPMGEYVLSMFEKIENSLEGPGQALPVNRAIVMDAASNSVRTLRSFAAQEKYHYITALDDNQWNPRKVRKQGRLQRYHYGNATLRDCEIELEDSQDKGYLITTRAIEISWDYGKRTVLITSFDPEVVGASEVVKAYFDRWPHEELQFRAKKAVACLNRVAGYGRQKLTDTKVVERQKKLATSMKTLRCELAEPLAGIAQEEQRIAALIKQERPLRARSEIKEGRRKLPKKDRERFEEIGRQIARSNRRIKAIEKPHAKSFCRLRKTEREWLRLQGKETVYKADVELDQIMTFFRVSLVNLYTLLAQILFGKARLSLTRLVHSVLFLPAEIQETADTKEVILEYNHKDHHTMACLHAGLQRINALACRTPTGKAITFRLSESLSSKVKYFTP